MNTNQNIRADPGARDRLGFGEEECQAGVPHEHHVVDEVRGMVFSEEPPRAKQIHDFYGLHGWAS